MKRGDVVLVDHPDFGRIVKQVSTVGKHGGIYLRGTSRHSTSAKKLGQVTSDQVVGILVTRLL